MCLINKPRAVTRALCPFHRTAVCTVLLTALGVTGRGKLNSKLFEMTGHETAGVHIKSRGRTLNVDVLVQQRILFE